MHIELLWIIPSVSFAFLISLIIYFVQKKSLQTDLNKEVANFNNGHAVNRNAKILNPEHRLEELEKTITIVTKSISNQQKIIDKFKKENSEYNVEISELKDKLRDLYKEYDIILSENYSLRAKMKKMMEKSDEQRSETDLSETPGSPQHSEQMNTDSSSKSKVNLKLYEDTRLLNISNFDDLDLSKVKSGS